MKPPHACSVPSLMDIDSFAPFEFHYPCEDMWWDLSDLSSSEPEDYDTSDSDLNISFSSSIYHTFFPDPEDEEDDTKDNVNDDNVMKDEDVMNDENDNVKDAKDDVDDEGELKDENDNEKDEESDVKCKEKEVFIRNVTSTILKIAPKSVYKRRKNAMKRKRNRQRRKRMISSAVDPEFRSLWINFVDVLPVNDAAISPLPTPTLPIIDLNAVNKTMLRKLPDVVDLPILSCDEDPLFYTKVVCDSYATRYSSSPIRKTKFDLSNPFGTLPGILTDMGPVPPPTDAFFGYVYADGGWKVKAELPSDPGGGHGRGGRLHQQEGRRGRGEVWNGR